MGEISCVCHNTKQGPVCKCSDPLQPKKQKTDEDSFPPPFGCVYPKKTEEKKPIKASAYDGMKTNLPLLPFTMVVANHLLPTAARIELNGKKIYQNSAGTWKTPRNIAIDIPLKKGGNIISCTVWSKTEVAKKTIEVTYDPNYSTARKDLIYLNTKNATLVADPFKNALIGKISTPLKSAPLRSILLPPNGHSIYTVSAKEFAKIDTATNRITRTYSPEGIQGEIGLWPPVLSPDEKYIYFGDSNSLYFERPNYSDPSKNHGKNFHDKSWRVKAFSLVSGKVVSETFAPHKRLALSPDGKTLYLSDGHVKFLPVKDLTQEFPNPPSLPFTDYWFNSMAKLSPDGKYLFNLGAQMGKGLISSLYTKILPADNSGVHVFNLSSFLTGDGGDVPCDIAFSPDNRSFFVASGKTSGHITSFDLQKWHQNKINWTVPVGSYPCDLAISGKGDKLYIVSQAGSFRSPGGLIELDTKDGKKTGELWLGTDDIGDSVARGNIPLKTGGDMVYKKEIPRGSTYQLFGCSNGLFTIILQFLTDRPYCLPVIE